MHLQDLVATDTMHVFHLGLGREFAGSALVGNLT